MQDHPVRRKRGKRAGQATQLARLRDIHSHLDGLPNGHHSGHSHNVFKQTSATGTMQNMAPLCESSMITEAAETHVIPRQSVTRKQLLSVLPQTVETEDLRGRQLDHSKIKGPIHSVQDAEKAMVEVTNPRVTWRSDKTLLRKGNPFGAEIGTFKREGVIRQGANTRKYIQTEKELTAVMEDQPATLPVDGFFPEPSK